MGLGRYTCKENSYQCAQIEANNRALDDRQRARDETHQEREHEQRQRDLELYKVNRRKIDMNPNAVTVFYYKQPDSYVY